MAGLLLLRPHSFVPPQYQRAVHIANILSLVFAGVALGIFVIFYFLFGWLDTLVYILLVALLFLCVAPVNRWVSHRLGRVMLCLIPVWLTFIITLLIKVQEPTAQTYIFYFDSRLILMATTILPGIAFRLEEKAQLVMCLGSTLFCLIFFDPIHELVGAGYFQKGFNDPSYYYINYITLITTLTLLFGILLMRSVLEQSEKNLENQNRELQRKQDEIETQHEELLAQQEEVLSSSEKLEQANRLITAQQLKLEKYNAKLEGQVEEKSQELVRTNAELIKHNNELLQFSYTVSHNFRGPVARLLGLTRLFQLTQIEEEKVQIRHLIVKASEELDEVLKDLNLIIDQRNHLYRVREKIVLLDEFKRALSLLNGNMSSDYQIDMDFSGAPAIYGVRGMVQSIFYNLLSNAIKYRSAERRLKVVIRSVPLPDMKILVEVTDNGLGFDADSQREHLFKLYKRFHEEIPGKGLGLYLVKNQMEALGGEVSVDSATDKGATFRLVFANEAND